MALTRKMLKAMDIDDEKIELIIDAHSDTVSALKSERDSYKTDAANATAYKSELDKANRKLADYEGDSSYKEKYDDLQQQFTTYKNEQAKKQTHDAKKSAYRNLLKNAGVAENRLDTVLKVSDFDGLKTNDDGSFVDADTLTESIKNEWRDFIVVQGTNGATVPDPLKKDDGNNDDQITAFRRALGLPDEED